MTEHTRSKFISVTEALSRAAILGIGVSRPTMLKWIKKYKMGHQLGVGKNLTFVVEAEKLEEFLNGQY